MFSMNIKKVDFIDYQLTLEEVMESFDESGKEMYEDIVEELLDDEACQAKPEAFWKKVTVTHLLGEQIQLDDLVFSSPYLCRRLEGVTEAYAFLATIGDSLWEFRKKAADPLEQYLIDAIMKVCLNQTFEKTAEEIVSQLPDKTGLYMDNPGHLAGWNLADQKEFLQLLDGGHLPILITDQNLFENSYSLSGIIYAKGIEPANCVLCPKPACSHRKAPFDGRELTNALHASAD